MNLWKKIRMRIRLEQIGADQDILKTIKKGLETVKLEKQEECEHKTLDQLIEKDMWYQCRKCKMVFFIQGASGWDVNQIAVLTKKLNESLKIKDEDERNEKSTNEKKEEIGSNKKKNK